MYEIDPNEILLDQLAQKREEEISKIRFEPPVSPRVFHVLSFLFFAIFLVFLLRVIQIQFIDREKYLSLSRQNKFSVLKVKAERGIIFDRSGRPLTTNEIDFALYWKKQESLNEKTIGKLAKILGIEKEALKKKIESSNEKEVLIAKHLDREKVILFLSLKDEFPEITVKEEFVRRYPEGEAFSHLLGYLGLERDELVGRMGLEMAYDEILKEKRGRIFVEKNVSGENISSEIISAPRPGYNLHLYLDSNLQKKMKEKIEEKMKELGIHSAAGIAIDPNTGGILGLVSLPTFDNNIFAGGNPEEIKKILQDPKNSIFNRAVDGQFPLGSTIKPFVGLSALKEKIITPEKEIDCEGEIKIVHPYNPQKIFRFKDWMVHGPSNLKKAIAESCNVYFYTIGGGYGNQKGLGITKLREYLEIFGFGKVPDVDFPVMTSGFIGSPQWKKERLKEEWWQGDTYNISIGQGYILTTPLQLAQAFIPIANPGKFLKPRFVWKITNENGELVKEFQPETRIENPFSLTDIEKIREGMREAVEGLFSPHASARLLSSLPVKAAAKTGTAQISNKNCPDCYVVWIATFAPFEKPEILLVLVFENVKSLSTVVSIPVAKEIFEWYFSSRQK